MIKNIYNVLAKLKSSSGFLARAYVGSVVEGIIEITSSKENFSNPIGKEFLISGNVIKIKDKRGNEIFKDKISKLTFENEKYTLTSKSGQIVVEKPEGKITVDYLVKDDWSKIVLTKIYFKTNSYKIKYLANNVNVEAILNLGQSVDLGSDEPSPNPDPIPNPIPVDPNWKDKIKKQMVFVSAPDYWFGSVKGQALDNLLDYIAKKGLTGVDIEFNGPHVAIEYIRNRKKFPVDLDEEYKKSFASWDEWLPKLRQRGLVASLKFWNSNGLHGKDRPDSWWRNLAKTFAQRYGSDNMLILGLNERDVNTPDSVGKAIYQGLVDGGFPNSQLIGYGSKSAFGISCGYSESHPQKSDASDIKGSDYTHINCTDSGQSISYLYENWKKEDGIGGKLRRENAKTYVKRVKNSKTSCSCYSFRQIPDYDLIDVISFVWFEGQTIPVPNPTPDGSWPSYAKNTTDIWLAGVDRDWDMLDANTVAGEVFKSGNSGTSFEMVANDKFFTGNPEDARAKFATYVSACRARKLIMFVCIWNDWADPKKISKANTLLDIVMDHGPEGFIVQPVGETHTNEGKAFESKAFKLLKDRGFLTCYNGNGGRPSSKPIGYDYVAWHTGGGNADCTAPKGYLEITDHGEKIRWLGNPHDPDKTEQLARNVKGRGCGFGLYRYAGLPDAPKPLNPPLPIAAWQRMGKVRGVQTNPTPTPNPTSNGDAIDISKVVLLGPHKNKQIQKVAITKKLYAADVSGKDVNITYENLGWNPNNSGIGSNIDGRVYIFWMNGPTLVGGHFEWKRPNQTVRDMKNLREGYLDGQKPSSGAKVWFALMDNSGGQRTNVVQSKTSY